MNRLNIGLQQLAEGGLNHSGIVTGMMQWRVRPVVPVAKSIAALALPALAAVFADGDVVRWGLAVAAAAAIAAWAARDVVVPVRLAADSAGVTVVVGFAGRRHVPWSQIESVRVESTARRGLRSDLLEIDAGDALFLFTTNDLSSHPEEVAASLAGLRGAVS